MYKYIFLLLLITVISCKERDIVPGNYQGVSKETVYKQLGEPGKGNCLTTRKSIDSTDVVCIGYEMDDNNLVVFHLKTDTVSGYHYTQYYKESLCGKNISGFSPFQVKVSLGEPFAEGYTPYFDAYKTYRCFYKVKPSKNKLFGKKYTDQFLIVRFTDNLRSEGSISIHDFGSPQMP